MVIQKSIYKCEICDKSFNSKYGLSGHKRIHGPSKGVPDTTNILAKNKILLEEKRKKYYENPRHCKNCDNILQFKSTNIFCSKTCSVSYTNKQRPPKSLEIKEKIRSTLRRKSKGILKPKTYTRWAMQNVIGPYTKITKGTCNYCKKSFFDTKRSTLCPEHRVDNKLYYRYLYSFKFDFNQYPDLFDLELISKIGFYSHKKGPTYNLNGFTKDHKVSVKDAIHNNYDPYYITHPLNCELMSYIDNIKKNHISSISYEILVKLVDEYEDSKS